MLDEVGLRFHSVLGVVLNRDEWPASVPAERPSIVGKVKISWYGVTEPHLVIMHCKDARKIALLLLPPNVNEDIALIAILMASTPGNDLSASETITRAAERASSLRMIDDQ